MLRDFGFGSFAATIYGGFVNNSCQQTLITTNVRDSFHFPHPSHTTLFAAAGVKNMIGNYVVLRLSSCPSLPSHQPRDTVMSDDDTICN